MGAIDAVGGRHAEGLFGGFAGSRDWRRGGRLVSARGGTSAGGRGIDGDRLGWSVAADREFRGQITEGPQPLATGGETSWLLALITQQADLTLEEIRERLAERGVQVAVSSIWRFYDRHGISFKKDRARRGAAAPGCGERAAPLEDRAPAET